MTNTQGFVDYYVHAVESAGGAPLIIPISDSAEAAADSLSRLDGLIFTGGFDITPSFYGDTPRHGLDVISPRRDRHEFGLMGYAVEQTDLPILCICRGMQMLNVYYGGTVYQALENERRDCMNHSLYDVYPLDAAAHEVTIERDSRVSALVGDTNAFVNSFHHQAVREVGNGLVVSATASDGIIEALEPADSKRFLAGVQWHPEMMVDVSEHRHARSVFEHFIGECTGTMRG